VTRRDTFDYLSDLIAEIRSEVSEFNRNWHGILHLQIVLMCNIFSYQSGQSSEKNS